MNNIEIAKSVTSLMTGATVGAVTGNIIKSYRNHSDNIVIELALDASTLVTSFVVGGMVHDAVKVQTDAKIDSAAAWINKIKSRKSQAK